ncbi:chemotaxis protein CheA [Sneathiella limimaris]|uniref:chemotaxis protein CheA n=1 Tax=Sneathiella limimaris TaxID=1964213 RepID=UPI00146B8365|nr:chemotaxis protein CheA [Sneathiella limimaris]
MDEFAQFKATYFAECAELLSDVETQLSELADASDDPEVMNAIFRAVHSIKAGAGAFKFTQLAEFSHEFEALLDRMRDGRIAVTEEGVSLLFRASDILSAMVESAENEEALTPEFGKEILDEITLMTKGEKISETKDVEVEEVSETSPEASDAKQKTYHISFAPKAELFKHANEPLLIVRELKTLGELTAEPDLDRLPSLASMDGEEAYFAWKFTLVSDEDISEIEEVFEFVTEDCDLSITVAGDTPSSSEIEKTDELASEASATAETKTAETAPEKTTAPAKTQKQAAPKVTSIRVELDRIDRLVNMVGELVITQSMLSQQTDDLPTEQYPNMVRGLEELALHTRELQESVMAIRMQPVKSVFSRMPRLVRELAAKLDKKVTLTTVGEQTEVDKTVIEEISDPITHMIRNSLDHGLESTEDRIAAGKPETGNVTLSAEHRGGRIVITISDDGRGINREAVLKRAIERGLIAENATPSDEEIDNMIFAPGFSTAEKVTDVSGRGVGMDVVRRNIQALGGRVSIQSNPGKGSRFTMTLPLTLAVMDGMIVQVGHAKYVIPIPNIVESLRPTKESLKKLPNGQRLVSIRGQYIPLCSLHQLFNIQNAESDPSKALVVLVESEEFGTTGIVVDELIGQQQVVIKSLENNYRPVVGISAATILGNGKVAPILDIEALYKISQKYLKEGSASGGPNNGSSNGSGHENIIPPSDMTGIATLENGVSTQPAG